MNALPESGVCGMFRGEHHSAERYQQVPEMTRIRALTAVIAGAALFVAALAYGYEAQQAAASAHPGPFREGVKKSRIAEAHR